MEVRRQCAGIGQEDGVLQGGEVARGDADGSVEGVEAGKEVEREEELGVD